MSDAEYLQGKRDMAMEVWEHIQSRLAIAEACVQGPRFFGFLNNRMYWRGESVALKEMSLWTMTTAPSEDDIDDAKDEI